MLRGHQTHTFREMSGRFNRGPDKENTPPNYFIDELNLMFSEDGVYTRDGSVLYLAGPATGSATKWNGTVRRLHEFKRINEASRLLILDNSFNIFDSTNLDAPILTVANMVDCSIVVLFNRAYISPSDGKRGLTGEKVYVYDGTGAARPAACPPPSGFTMAGANGTVVGHIDKGDHLFAVVYESVSGAYSKMGLGVNEYVKFTSDGTNSLKLTGIPTGPSYIAKRHIIATRLLKDYNGDPKLQDWFFIPNATIENNVDTTLDNINFYDGDLADDAGYLLYNLSEIPAGAKLIEYAGRLVVGGEAIADAQCRVSAKGEPESISDLDGTIIFDPGDAGGGVKNGVEHRGILYVMKGQRTYATSDNGSSPNSWAVSLIDGNIGAEPFSASVFLDSKVKSTRDQFAVADRSGFFLFNGTYGANRELSFAISGDWQRINSAYFHNVQVVVNPIDYKIYIAVPLDDATVPSHIFLCAYDEGLAWDKVKWSLWTLPKNINSVILRTVYTTGLPELQFGSDEGSIYKFDPEAANDFGNVVVSFCQFPFIGFSASDGLSLFSALRCRVVGEGSLTPTLIGSDNVLISYPPEIDLALAPGVNRTRLINFVTQRLSVKLGVESANEWFELRSLIVSGVEYWQEIPA